MNHTRCRALLTASLTAIIVAGFGETARAQAPAAPADQATGGGLEEIVVTARKREEVQQSVPLSLTAFNGAKLDKMNIGDLTSLGKVIPNVSIDTEGPYVGGLAIGIRGVTEQDPILTNDSPIALYLDGVYIARAVGVPIAFVDLDRVEVARGPQGTLFGRNTTGGVVNIITKGPSDEFGLSQKIDYGSNNELTTRTVVNTGEFGSLGLKAKLTWQHHQMDGWLRNPLTSNPSEWGGADDSDSVHFALHGSFTDAFDFDYRFDYTSESSTLAPAQITYMQPTGIAYFGKSPAFGGAPLVVSPSYLNSVPIYPADPRSTLVTLGHGLTLNYSINDMLSLKSITGYRSMAMNARQSLVGQGDLKGFVLNPATFQPAGVQSVTPFTVDCTGLSQDNCDNQHQYQFSEELQASGVIDSFKYTAGLYYFTEHVGETDPQSYTIVFSPLAGATFNALDNYVGKSTSYAAYAQTTYTPPILDGNLDLTGGVRFTRDEKAVDIFNQDRQLSHRFNALSGDFTINYRFSPDVMGYFRFANSYKAGGFNARDPGPGYQPEYANNFEGGLKSDWFNKHLRVNADIFYTEYTNQQISTFVALTGNQGAGTATITVNAGASTYFGGELEATIIPADGWEINTSFGYTDANYQQFPYAVNGTNVNVADIAKFPYFSKASFNTGIQYTFDPMPWGDLSARADFAYKSGQVFHPNPLQDPLEDVLASQSQTDLGANITMAHIPTGYGKSEFTAEVYGRNLLDQHLRLQAVDFSAFAPGGFGNDTYSRGRVLGFSLKVDY